MTPEEKKTLAQIALLSAHDKSRTMDVIRGLLSAAEDQCRSLQKCHSTFGNDPEIETLRKQIFDLQCIVPRYSPNLMEVALGINELDYEYVTGNDIWELRAKDLGIDPYADRNDNWEMDVKWEDPLNLYKRLTHTNAETAQPAWVPCPSCDNYRCTIHSMHADECPCPPADEWTDDPCSIHEGG